MKAFPDRGTPQFLARAVVHPQMAYVRIVVFEGTPQFLACAVVHHCEWTAEVGRSGLMTVSCIPRGIRVLRLVTRYHSL